MQEKQYPNRQSLRLKLFDYSRNGAYFVTLCTYERQRLFGQPGMPQVDLRKSNMLTDGITKRPHRAGVFEPNVGATLCGRPQQANAMIEKWFRETENKFDGVWLDSYVIMPEHVHFILMIWREMNVAGDHTGSPLQNQMPYCQDGATLGDIVGWFKTMTTNEYIKGVKQGLYKPFESHLWQRNYYERVIRNEDELYEMRRYISENPIRWDMDGEEPF